MDDFDLEIKREFINEALINLDDTESAFMELEGTADPKPLLDQIFRLAHNLKGGSRAVGFGQVAEFTHQLENLVQKIQKEEMTLSAQLVTTLLRSNDRLIEMLSELKVRIDAQFDNSDLLVEIKKWLDGEMVSEPPQAETASASPAEEASPQVEGPEPQPVVEAQNEIQPEPSSELAVPSAEDFFKLDENLETTAETTVEVPAAMPVEGRPVQKEIESAAKPDEGFRRRSTDKADDEVIRVNLSRIDTLNNFVGELIVLQSVVQQQVFSADPKTLYSTVRQMVKISKNIQELSMGLRMLPVKPLLQKLQRVVRDTAQTLSKDVDFEIVGEQIEVDKSVLDRLSDPLIHIVRNAVDHGIEAPEERAKANKPSKGKVTLSFSNEGNHLVVEAKDDGKGINPEVLRKKAIEKKIISENQQMNEKQLINLIFHAGFSTKAQASEISGRGVGMDVVKTNVEKIGGSIDISSTVGAGSLFRLKIPLSLAVFDGLVITGKTNRYVIPLNQVQETINLRSYKVFNDKLGLGSCFELRKTVVPLFDLDEILDAKKSNSLNDGIALIVHIDDRPVGLVVKDILRAQQIVIKPLSNGIQPQRGWIGSCVLGDGLPTIILSPIDLLAQKIVYVSSDNRLGESA